ncbi:MAG TPA: ion channel [Alphaproteobacteria bacterium]|nr:ion channel [Alphaproteobacteria bacterium]
MKRLDRHWITAIAFTAALVLLVSLAVSDVIEGFVYVLLVTVIVAVGVFYKLLPRSHFIAAAFANLIAVYACLFVFFVETNFPEGNDAVLLVGFVLPIAAFLLAIAWRHRDIRAIVNKKDPHYERNLAQVLRWLVPIFAIGLLTFAIPSTNWGPLGHDLAFLAAMTVIALVVSLVVREVVTFLLETALLFEEFFERIARLLVPAFAFFTFYSFLVIVFGAIYRIADHLSTREMFAVAGIAQKISFPDALYFSIVTLSTVGYGDIVPVTNLARFIVAIQIVCGILLLLFGFSEIIAYTRAHREHSRTSTHAREERRD